MKETIKRAFLGALVFLGTILFGFIGYSAWTNLIADIPNQNSGDIMTSAIWNNLVDKLNKTIDNVNLINTSISNINSVPSGAVMAFNLSACPSGWSSANGSNGTPDLRGEFIRGLDNGRGVDSGRVLVSNQSDMFKSHHHAQATQNGLAGNRETSNNIGQGYDYGDGYGEVPTSDAGGTETRPRNVALLYCVKN